MCEQAAYFHVFVSGPTSEKQLGEFQANIFSSEASEHVSKCVKDKQDQLLMHHRPALEGKPISCQDILCTFKSRIAKQTKYQIIYMACAGMHIFILSILIISYQ